MQFCRFLSFLWNVCWVTNLSFGEKKKKVLTWVSAALLRPRCYIRPDRIHTWCFPSFVSWMWLHQAAVLSIIHTPFVWVDLTAWLQECRWTTNPPLSSWQPSTLHFLLISYFAPLWLTRGGLSVFLSTPALCQFASDIHLQIHIAS